MEKYYLKKRNFIFDDTRQFKIVEFINADLYAGDLGPTPEH